MADIGDRGFIISQILKEFEPGSKFKTSDEAPASDPCVETPILFPALAKLSGGQDHENDYEAVVLEVPNDADTASFNIQTWNGASWGNLGISNDPALGTYNDKGFNSDKPNFTTYTVDWQSVLAAHGEGIYRIRTTITTDTPSATNQYYSDLFCLKEYSTVLANSTIRLDFIYSKIIGKNEQRVDYGNINIPSSRRIQGFFGNEEVEMSTTEVEYTNRQIEVISNDSIRKFTLTTGRLAGINHDFIRDVFMTGTVVIHDFNTNNERDYKNEPVVLDGSYSPDYKTGSPTVLSRVELSLKEQKKVTGKDYC